MNVSAVVWPGLENVFRGPSGDAVAIFTHPLARVWASGLRHWYPPTLRYRCECAANEVLQISVAFDAKTTEEQFLFTMRALWRDVQFEVEQHLRCGELPAKTSSGVG
jgi:hypothetical protein